MTITAAHAACDTHGRARLVLTATKPAELTAQQVSVGVAGARFWASVAKEYGGGVASVGRTMLPKKAMPKYLSAPELHAAGSTALELTFTADRAAKHLAKLRDRGDAAFLVQGQAQVGKRGTPPSILFEFVARPSDVCGPGNGASTTRDIEVAVGAEAAVREDGTFGPAILRELPLDTPKPELGSEPMQDVLWSVVSMELLQLLVDILRVVATSALLLAPWRFAALLTYTCEPVIRQRSHTVHAPPSVDLLTLLTATVRALWLLQVKRWQLRLVDSLDAFLHDESAHAAESITALRSGLCTAVRGSEQDYPLPRLGHQQLWHGPPLPTSDLYIGLEKASKRAKVLKKLSKYDDALAKVWTQLLAAQPLHRLCVVMEAELLRGMLFPLHWLNLQGALQQHAQGRTVNPFAARRSPFSQATVVAQPVSQAHSAAALLRTVDTLREAVASEEAALHQQLSDERSKRRALLAPCKVASLRLTQRHVSFFSRPSSAAHALCSQWHVCALCLGIGRPHRRVQALRRQGPAAACRAVQGSRLRLALDDRCPTDSL